MKFNRQEKEKLKTALRELITESYQSYYELRKKLGDRWQVGHIASVIQEMTHEIERTHIVTRGKLKYGPLAGMSNMRYVVRKRPIEGIIRAKVIDAI